MKVGIPHFGFDTLALKGFIEELGAEVVLPPPTSKRTVEIGVKLAPELVCMPFKITLGNFAEALERGADTLLMAAGARKCRFGYYHFLQEQALRQVKQDFRLVPVSQYSASGFIFKLIPELFGVSPLRVMRAVCRLLVKSALTRDFRRLLNRKRAVDFAGAEQVKGPALSLIEQARTISEMKRARQEMVRLFGINGKRADIRIGLVGEIFYTVDQRANQEIEKELARLGAEVVFERCLYNHLLYLLHIDAGYRRSRRLAKPYLAECPGGEAIRTVGEARQFVMRGVDGIVQVFPFTCMPENIALEALQRISEQSGVPLLFLSFDEHTSTTGLVTRLEAFVELLRRRKYARRVSGN